MFGVSYFFYIIGLFTTLLIATTLFRKTITFKGIFTTFVFFLAIFSAHLIYIFNDMILHHSISEMFLPLSTMSWSSLELALSLRLDGLGYLFVLLVTIIGFATNIYTLNYFKYEAHEDNFLLLINWFIFSMIILVLANNLFTLFLGWESIGLTSFFLINFWNTRRGTLKSSFKAFVFNKISDVFLFLFIIFIYQATLTQNIANINVKILTLWTPVTHFYTYAAVSLLICTLFKSAQIIGHLWLPDSMEAPVPASALIHSATLVSAGVYLLLRFTPLISLTNLHPTILIIGSITAAYGGVVSAAQTDMKKLLAYSTISHCGFLFVAVGTQVYTTVIIYLYLHGLFKALTFFCAGSIIRVAGSQDTRQMGALNRIIPVDTIFLIICAFNLGGLPFSLGYLYKNALIASLLMNKVTPLALGFVMIGLLSSIVYVYRLVYYSVFDIAKEFFPNFIYELQQKQIDVTNYHSLTTIVQIVAVTTLLLFTCWIYVYFNSYFISSGLVLDHTPVIFESDVELMRNSVKLYKYYYELFYGFYVFVVLILMIIGWRIEYTFDVKFDLIVKCCVCSLIFSVITMLL